MIVPTPNHVYPASITRVVDGDTLDGEIDLGFRVMRHVRFRLARVNAPELRSDDEQVRAAGAASRAFLEKQLMGRPGVVIRSSKADAWDRWIAEVWVGDTNLSDELLATGNAVPYVKK